jgi:L-lactate dehydrogenase complex protein LldG
MEHAENPARGRILTRIQTALKSPAPRHERPGQAARIFAPVDDPLSRFQRECAANSTELIVVPDAGAAAAALVKTLEAVPAGEVYVQDAPFLRRILENSLSGHVARWSNIGPPAESSQATITGAECLVASTGSILVASSAAGRGASVVAPVHIVLASVSQLEPDLAQAFIRANERRLPEQNSALFLITGSSRTADIEKILVLGAHGPRRVVVILVHSLT